jgi:hypothetical protein
MDIVPTMFPSELLSAYPDAKVLLTTRSSADTWYSSMEATFWHAYRPEPDSKPTKRLVDKCLKHKFSEDIESGGKKAYEEHNVLVKELAEGRVLDFKPEMGWEPLCRFLELEIPKGEYPRVDSWMEYKKRFGTM